jgi:hypothetical protein
LLAGRFSGYPQLVLAIAGLLLSLIFGVRLAVWYFSNWSRFHGPDADALEIFGELWTALRWPLLGIGVFAAGWVWALGTSLVLLSSARDNDPPRQAPPRLTEP